MSFEYLTLYVKYIYQRVVETNNRLHICDYRYPMKDYLDFVPVSCEMYRQWVIENNFCK